MEHLIFPDLLTRRVKVHLIGVGGNGAQMVGCLARVDVAIRAFGHPHGLVVTAFDGDSVSESNIGRQLFFPADVGMNKAGVMVQRTNLAYGLDWSACPCNYRDEDFEKGRPDIVISCVDTRSTRRRLHKLLFGASSRTRYWLDLGNTDATGQVVLGIPRATAMRIGEMRLPCVTELFPDLLDPSVPDDNAPSCSVRVSLESQGLFVNDVAVRFASQLLYELFTRKMTEHGVLLNLASKRTAPIQIDAAVWERFGYTTGKRPSSARTRRPPRAKGARVDARGDRRLAA